MNEYTKPEINSTAEQITVSGSVSKVIFKGIGLAASSACSGKIMNSSQEKSDKKRKRKATSTSICKEEFWNNEILKQNLCDYEPKEPRSAVSLVQSAWEKTYIFLSGALEGMKVDNGCIKTIRYFQFLSSCCSQK